jgi:hypothetical protein
LKLHGEREDQLITCARAERLDLNQTPDAPPRLLAPVTRPRAAVLRFFEPVA